MKHHDIHCKQEADIESSVFEKVEVTNVALFRSTQASVICIYAF